MMKKLGPPVGFGEKCPYRISCYVGSIVVLFLFLSSCMTISEVDSDEYDPGRSEESELQFHSVFPHSRIAAHKNGSHRRDRQSGSGIKNQYAETLADSEQKEPH